MQDIYRINGIIEINHKCRTYCTLPYPNHPKGCPNFNKHKECPPIVKTVDKIFDLDNDLFFVVEHFNLKNHVEIMARKHPTWTDRQCRNLLYWQGGVRKRLEQKTQKFIEQTDPTMIYTLLPEAMGVMVIDTAQKLGIPIEKQPVNNIYKIALVGYSKTFNYFK